MPHAHPQKLGFHREGGGSEDGSVRGNAQLGFSETRRSVTRLNHHVVEALVRAGVSAVGNQFALFTSTKVQMLTPEELALSPFPRWTTRDGRVGGCHAGGGSGVSEAAGGDADVQAHECGGSWAADAVNSLVNQGFVPVLHGDAVLDLSLGCSILSGTQFTR